MLQAIDQCLVNWSIEPVYARYLTGTILLTLVILISYIARLIVKRVLIRVLQNAAARTENVFDDILVESGVLNPFSHFVPLLIFYFSTDLIFSEAQNIALMIKRILLSIIVIVSICIINEVLNSVEKFYRTFEISKKTPIKGYVQLIKIFLIIIAVVFVISTLLNISPWGILSSIGAMTAIILLIFKDSILGLVASIQLNANNMVNIGDWIEMPKYDADGDVIDISLNTIKVRNFDMTITTIPTYALISDSFKNWRGMKSSGGRRMKRIIYVDINSITFCTEEMLECFKKYHLIRDYIELKEQEVAAYNEEQHLNVSEMVNGRRLTNIGTFRAYILEYLRNHPMVNQDMTLLVRHLQPTEHGLPVEIYAFIKDKAWGNYESIQADIFDHILAIVPFFRLRLFQQPTGWDFNGFAKHIVDT